MTPPRDFTCSVPPELTGHMLDAALRAIEPGLSWAQARSLVTTGKVRVNGEARLDVRFRVRGGDELALSMAAPRPSAQHRLGRDTIAFVDGQVVVVRKPAGISTVPFEEGERGTLDQLIRALLSRDARGRGGAAQATLGVVQRLDRDTTGLLVFARTLAAKKHLAQQFRAHTVHRRYVAIVHGTMMSRTVRSRLVANRGDGLRGSTRAANLGQEAVTHVEALAALEGATLVACRLETGRTHQIRVHLAESGHPLVGEPVYIRGFSGPRLQASRVMLHAAELGFLHPRTGEPAHFYDPAPGDFVTTLRALNAPPEAIALVEALERKDHRRTLRLSAARRRG